MDISFQMVVRMRRNTGKTTTFHRRKAATAMYSEDICLQTLTSFSITWVKITRACGWQKSFRAGQILCAQTIFQHNFRQVSIFEFPSTLTVKHFHNILTFYVVSE